MRILHAESSLELGGREMAVLDIVQGLRTHGHHVVLAMRRGSALVSLARRRNIPFYTFRMSKGLYPVSVQEFRALICREKIEVVHMHSSRDRWMATIAAYLTRPRPTLVLSRHHCGPIRDSLLNRLLYGYLTDCIVTTGGETLRRELLESRWLDSSRVASIPTGVDLERFHPGVDGASVRQELGIPPEAFVVGTVSFLRNYKGLPHFIAAAERGLQRAPRRGF
jgi:glycosyltransferase involved in cell wall biosynthesis